MNVEKEWKAFVKAGNEIYCQFENYPRNCTEFQVWCKAKAHVYEMAKPLASLIYIDADSNWLLETPVNGFKTIFKNKREAILHAENNGYRVIE